MITAACLGAGAFVQATVGFGMGVVSIPLLVWSGFSLPTAIGALLPNVLIQTASGCFRHRRQLPWSDIGWLVALRYLSVPVGIAGLALIAAQGQAISRAVLGIGLLGSLLLQQVRPRPTGPPSSSETVIAGVASGFLAGLIGMGGPPLVLWVMRRGWSSTRQRSFLWLSFLLVLPLQIALMWYRFGTPWLQSFQAGSLVVPLTFLIAISAGRWADRWSQERLRFAMRLFLLLVAVRLIVQLGWDAA